MQTIAVNIPSKPHQNHFPETQPAHASTLHTRTCTHADHPHPHAPTPPHVWPGRPDTSTHRLPATAKQKYCQGHPVPAPTPIPPTHLRDDAGPPTIGPRHALTPGAPRAQSIANAVARRQCASCRTSWRQAQRAPAMAPTGYEQAAETLRRVRNAGGAAAQA